jgi:hypothetical protein
MCGHPRRDRVRNDNIRHRVGVAPIAEKLVQHRLRWFGHISGWRADNVKRGRLSMSNHELVARSYGFYL